MPEHYTVISTQPWVYIDPTGRTVDGFRVHFTIKGQPEFVSHFVDVPVLTPTVVKPRIEQLIKDIQSLMG